MKMTVSRILIHLMFNELISGLFGSLRQKFHSFIHLMYIQVHFTVYISENAILRPDCVAGNMCPILPTPNNIIIGAIPSTIIALVIFLSELMRKRKAV